MLCSLTWLQSHRSPLLISSSGDGDDTLVVRGTVARQAALVDGGRRGQRVLATVKVHVSPNVRISDWFLRQIVILNGSAHRRCARGVVQIVCRVRRYGHDHLSAEVVRRKLARSSPMLVSVPVKCNSGLWIETIGGAHDH